VSQKEGVGLIVVVAEKKTGAYSDPHPHLHPLAHPIFMYFTINPKTFTSQ